MNNNVLKRIQELETKYKQDPLMVLAKTDSGEEIKISMRECIARKDTHFIKVISGRNLQDLDLFLEAVKADAYAQAGKANNDKRKIHRFTRNRSRQGANPKRRN